MDSLLPAVFAASLVGSMHCVGMCGPLLAVALGAERTPDGNQGSRPTVTQLQLAYHGARGLGYAVLGALAGAAGQLVDLGGALAGLQPIAASLAAATLLVTGVAILARQRGWRVPHFGLPGPLSRGLRSVQRRALKMPPMFRALGIGASTALLPCGWLYAFAAVAAGTAHPVAGALVMTAFFAGSVPLLSALGFGVHRARAVLSPRWRSAFSVALIALGLWALTGRSQLDSIGLLQSASAGTQQELPSGADAPACCASDER
jgi:sulfite exporter TauE/SafE